MTTSPPSPNPSKPCYFRSGFVHWAAETNLRYHTICAGTSVSTQNLNSIPLCLLANTQHDGGPGYSISSVIARGDGASGMARAMSITETDMNKWFQAVSFSKQLLNPVRTAGAVFVDQEVEFSPLSQNGSRPLSVAVRLATYKGYFNVFMRLDPQKHQFHLFAASSVLMNSKERLPSWLKHHAPILVQDPLSIIEYFEDIFIREGLGNTIRKVTGKLNLHDKSLGVNEWDEVSLERMTKRPRIVDLDKLNGSSVQAQYILSCGQSILTQFRGLQQSLENLKDLVYNPDEPRERSHSAYLKIKSESLHALRLGELDKQQRRLDSLNAVLYNLMVQRDTKLNYEIAKAAKQDSSAMKTIAIMTLTYLPATFVSSIFSTTVFDFQNWGERPVATGAWWPYLIRCVLLTLATFGAWAVWTRWEEKKWNSNDMKSGKNDQQWNIKQLEESGAGNLEDGLESDVRGLEKGTVLANARESTRNLRNRIFAQRQEVSEIEFV